MEANNSKKAERIIKWAIEKASEENTKENQNKKTSTSMPNNTEEKRAFEDANGLKYKNKMCANICLLPPKGGRMLTFENIGRSLRQRNRIWC